MYTKLCKQMLYGPKEGKSSLIIGDDLMGMGAVWSDLNTILEKVSWLKFGDLCLYQEYLAQCLRHTRSQNVFN